MIQISDGGPCSIIACVQAFLLRELLFCTKCGNEWRKPTGLKSDLLSYVKGVFKFYYFIDEELNLHLSDALLSIFINVSSDNPKYLVFYEDENYEINNENDLRDANNARADIKDENASTASTSKATSYNPKRAKLDYDAFTKKLRSDEPISLIIK